MKIEVHPSIANAFVSWKTSLAGVIAFVAINAPQLIDYLQHNTALNAAQFWTGFALLAMGLVSRDGNVSSEQAGAKPDEVPLTATHFHEVKQDPPQVLPPIAMLMGALFFATLLTGCTTSVAIAKSQKDVSTAVSATATQDVPFIAHFIADTWAAHETAEATRLFNAAIAENSVSATIAPAGTTIPAPTTPQTTATVRVVPEPMRTNLQAKHDQDLAQIAIGKQQIYQAVINRFAGNLAAAQALLDGQANYYKTVGANQSTLQTGLDGVLNLFQQFAPVISTALAPKAK